MNYSKGFLFLGLSLICTNLLAAEGFFFPKIRREILEEVFKNWAGSDEEVVFKGYHPLLRMENSLRGLTRMSTEQRASLPETLELSTAAQKDLLSSASPLDENLPMLEEANFHTLLKMLQHLLDRLPKDMSPYPLTHETKLSMTNVAIIFRVIQRIEKGIQDIARQTRDFSEGSALRGLTVSDRYYSATSGFLNSCHDLVFHLPFTPLAAPEEKKDQELVQALFASAGSAGHMSLPPTATPLRIARTRVGTPFPRRQVRDVSRSRGETLEPREDHTPRLRPGEIPVCLSCGA